MKVISDFGPPYRNLTLRSCVVLGVFDGVHRGHQALIRAAVLKAKSEKIPSVIVTFHPHPVWVLNPHQQFKLIFSLDYRIKLFEQLGLDICAVIKFTSNFASLAPETFVQQYLVSTLHPREVFVGDDFRFGQHRSGNLELFKTLGEQNHFSVNGFAPIKGRDNKISSSTIRHHIAGGQLKAAQNLLGRPVSILSRVISGDGRGRLLGFPTANLDVCHQLLPPDGVYAVRVRVCNKLWLGMANIGIRPSFSSVVPSDNPHLEVHLFDFHRNIYHEEIYVEFHKKLRNERKFLSMARLIAQLHRDEKKARQFFKDNPLS